jgi:hypothetical protein
MLSIHFGTEQFQTPQARNCWICLTLVTEISAPQCCTHYSPAGNCDVLDIVVHQNVHLSEVIVSDVLDLDHLPIVFHILDHVTIRNLSDPVEKFTDWERFQSLASDLASPRIQINSGGRSR